MPAGSRQGLPASRLSSIPNSGGGHDQTACPARPPEGHALAARAPHRQAIAATKQGPRGHRGRGVRSGAAAQPFHEVHQVHRRPVLGWLELHEGGTFVRLTQCGADLSPGASRPMKDAFDQWWEWANKPFSDMATIPAEIHEPVIALSLEDRHDRAKATKPCGFFAPPMRSGPAYPTKLSTSKRSHRVEGICFGPAVRSGSKVGSLPACPARPLYRQERTSLGAARAGRQALHAKTARPKPTPVGVTSGRTVGSLRMREWPSIVPGAPEDFYIVVNHFGRFGTAFAETDLDRANFETIIADLMSGQHNDPLRVIMFNPETNRSEDVSHAIAQEILRRLDLEGRSVPTALLPQPATGQTSPRMFTAR